MRLTPVLGRGFSPAASRLRAMDNPPPLASRIPSVRTMHDASVTDEYAWLLKKDDPATLAYLEAENAHTEQAVAGLAALREDIFEEIKGRTQETDLTVPARKGDWWYYTRTVEGQQYRIHCRRSVLAGEVLPPLATDGQPLAGEQV